MGMISYVILSWCFCWIWLWNWLVFELCVCDGFKQLDFRYLWTCVVITMWTPMYVRYLWTTCEMDVTCGLLCWIMYDLGCMRVGLKSFVVQRTTGFIWVQVWRFDHSGDCCCTCALINWLVLLQLALEQGSTLNLSHGYLKQRFYFIKSCWQLIAKYRCVKNLNFKFRVCQWSYPLCPVKDYQVAN